MDKEKANEKLTKILQTLLDSDVIDELLDLHKIDCISRVNSISNALFTTSIILSIITFIVLLIVNSQLIWIGILYWIIASLLIFGISLGIDRLIDNEILCKEPIINFVVADTTEELLAGEYHNYSEKSIPTQLLLEVLTKTVPIFKKEPFYITIKFLGTKAIYKFDGNTLTDDAYNKILNGINILE